jgi:hypothetical protein
MLSSGIQCHVVSWKLTDVSENHIASIWVRCQHATCFYDILFGLYFHPEHWRDVTPKRRPTFNRLHGVISHAIAHFKHIFGLTRNMSVTLSTPLEYFDSLHLYVQSVQITEEYLIIFRVNISSCLVRRHLEIALSSTGKNNFQCRTWGSHSGIYESCRLLRH